MTEPDLTTHLRPELDEVLLALDELCTENPEEALSMFDNLPEPVQALPDFQLALARTYQAKGELEIARDLAKKIEDAPEYAADAHHFLGDVLEDLGQLEQANQHFLKTLELDQAQFEQDAIDGADLCARLSQLVRGTLADLPREIAPTVQAARLEVKLFPSNEEVLSGRDPRSLVSFEAPDDSQSTCLTLYAANLYAEYGDLEEFDEFAPHIQDCIHQEIIAFLELSAPESRRLGLLRDD